MNLAYIPQACGLHPFLSLRLPTLQSPHSASLDGDTPLRWGPTFFSNAATEKKMTCSNSSMLAEKVKFLPMLCECSGVQAAGSDTHFIKMSPERKDALRGQTCLSHSLQILEIFVKMSLNPAPSGPGTQ